MPCLRASRVDRTVRRRSLWRDTVDGRPPRASLLAAQVVTLPLCIPADEPEVASVRSRGSSLQANPARISCARVHCEAGAMRAIQDHRVDTFFQKIRLAQCGVYP